jgi:hypothetical protein
MRNGRGEADLGAKRRDHEGSRASSMERAPSDSATDAGLTTTQPEQGKSKEDANLPDPPQAVLPKTGTVDR